MVSFFDIILIFRKAVSSHHYQLQISHVLSYPTVTVQDVLQGNIQIVQKIVSMYSLMIVQGKIAI